MTVAELAPSLRPLVLLLSSDKPGEVAAAAAQIGRKLSRAGLDWHSLADALDGPAENVAELYQPAPATSWADAIAWIVMNEDDALSDRDHEFVLSMRRILARGYVPTPKQAAWLMSIAEQVRREACYA